MANNTLASLLEARVVVIFRGMPVDRALAAADVMYEAGLRAYEVTLQSGDTLRTIELLRDKLPPDALVRAGTVLTPTEVADAQAAGATYIISPNVDPDVVAATKERNLVSMPGAFTATEILQAHRAGADIVKVFPVRPVGADYIRQIRGPVADVKLLASGGVDADLAAECYAAGCQSVGVGQQLFGAGAVDDEDWGRVSAAATRFVEVARAAS